MKQGSDTLAFFLFPNKNCLKHGDAYFPMPFNFTLEHNIRKFQENLKGLEN